MRSNLPQPSLSGLTASLSATLVPSKRAGAPVSRMKLYGPLPLILTRIRTWFVLVNLYGTRNVLASIFLTSSAQTGGATSKTRREQRVRLMSMRSTKQEFITWRDGFSVNDEQPHFKAK